MTTGTIIGITASGVAIIAIGYGLYRLGKNVQNGNVKVKRQKIVSPLRGESLNELFKDPTQTGTSNKQEVNKQIVEFEHVDLYKFEDLINWVNSVDIPDADTENLTCHIVRKGEEFNSYNIDLSSLSEQDIENVFVAHVLNKKTHHIYSSKWIIASKLDSDLIETFGDCDAVNIE